LKCNHEISFVGRFFKQGGVALPDENITFHGQITRLQSGFYTVHTGEGQFTCKLRKKIKRSLSGEDFIAIGDFVNISLQSDGSGVIEELLPRSSTLVRMAPTPGGMEPQVMLANADQIILVFACAHPDPHVRMLDRFLVICEKQELPVIIVANKTDLITPEKAHEFFDLYKNLGYPLVFTSTKTGAGVDELHEKLSGKLSAFAGPSGVGKTSLLNAIQPHLGLEVREVSNWHNKGRHTTVVRQIFPLQNGGFVADMPGLRSLALWDTTPEELDGYFPELRALVAQCQFNDCTHRTEPGCAVRAAVEEGKISPARYDSYLRLREEETVKG
jgi:ribosome biogenesis GTPase